MPRELPLFYPPQSNRWITRILQHFAEPLTRVFYRFDIRVSQVDVAKLKALKDNRLVYICNHPTMEDGAAIFGLSAQLGQQFNYIVSWGSFEGLQGKVLQALGCYSLRRGSSDRASIAQTLRLLQQPRCRLTIFPEGGCTYQNNAVMPFLPGAIQMPLKAMDLLTKQGPEKCPNLYLVPVSLKYCYMQPIDHLLEQGLQALETRLDLPHSIGSVYERLVAIATRIIEHLESEFNLSTESQLTLHQRTDRLRQQVRTRCKHLLNLELSDNRSFREHVYRIQAVLETKFPKTEDDNALYLQTIRLLNFDTIYSGYITQNSSLASYLDTLTRLECETFKTEYLKPKAVRRATFKIGEPINLNAYISAYRTNKTGTVEKLTQQIQTVVQDNLLTP